MSSGGWEYADFRLDIPTPQQWACRITGDHAYTTAAATAHWWQNMQRWILPQLQSWLDEGWEPVTEVGPGGFTPQYFWPLFSPTATGFMKVFERVVLVVLFPYILISWLTGDIGQFMKPTSFTVNLRRRKQ
jgi:hypothetical protein